MCAEDVKNGRVEAVIFDLDGTLTEPYLDFDRIRVEMGLSVDSGPVWEAMAAMSGEQRSRAAAILDRHEQRAIRESKLNAGTRETLDAINAAGIPIGILTRNTCANAEAVCTKHGLKFDAVIGRDEGPVKPDAFGVLELCKKFCVEPAQTLVVGDYLYDLQSARAAGAKAVLFKTHKNAEQFCQWANYCIEKMPELLEIIELNR